MNHVTVELKANDFVGSSHDRMHIRLNIIMYDMPSTRKGNLLSRAIQASREEGKSIVFRYIWKQYVTRYSELAFYKIFKRWKKFVIDGKSYRYRYSQYNNTWRNERAIEIPFAHSIVKEFQGQNILEVGNVLSYYYLVTHDILDKYERGAHIINADIATFEPKKFYDLVLCISTLEHVGKDYGESEDSEKALLAFRRLEQMRPKKLVITIPLGYNKSLDRHIMTGRIKFSKTIYMKRVSKDNQWQQINSIENVNLDSAYPNTNILLIGIINNEAGPINRQK